MEIVLGLSGLGILVLVALVIKLRDAGKRVDSIISEVVGDETSQSHGI